MKQLALCALLLVSCLAAGQEFPRYELSTGYAYGRVDNAGVGNRLYAQGWLGSFAANVKSWAALEVSAGGQYNNQLANLQGTTYALNSGFYSFLGGPRVAFRSSKITPFAHSLFGIGRALDYSKATFDSTAGTVHVPHQNAFGAAVGGGIDYGISRRLALRTQGDYFITQLSGNFGFSNQNNFRAVAGLVFSFGGRSGSDYGTAMRTRSRRSTSASTAVVPSESESAPSYQSQPVESASSAPAAPASVVAPQNPASNRSSGAPAAARTSVLGYVVPAAPQRLPQTIESPAPSPAPAAAPSQPQEEESLGDIARRYRAKKKAQRAIPPQQ